MLNFFGTPWDDLTLERVTAFMAEQEDEGLTWETKGTEIRSASVLKAVCGFANQVGGFLIIGARREGGRWVLDGVAFPDEPRVWLSNVIDGGLDPRPTFDVHAWEVEEGRHVAVMRVEQIATPPCVTSSGQVYQRLPGKTEPVSEASILARLFERGERARESAEALALQAVEREFALAGSAYLVIHVGVGPTGTADDIAAVLFGPTFEEGVSESFERLPNEPLLSQPSEGLFSIKHTRAALIAEPYGDDSQRWRIRCRWDGSVLVSLALYPGDAAPRLLPDPVFDDAVRPAVSEALHLTRELGGFGPAHVVLKFETGGFQLRLVDFPYTDHAFPESRVQAWAEDWALSDEALERWKREILRDAGIRTHEPGEP
jgi:hypothetical protein